MKERVRMIGYFIVDAAYLAAWLVQAAYKLVRVACKREGVRHVARVFGFTTLSIATLVVAIATIVVVCGVNIGPGSLF